MTYLQERDDQRTGGVGSAELTQLRRQLRNAIRSGHIAAVDHTGVEIGVPAARVWLDAERLTTQWLPWITPRAADDHVWDPPDLGEHVLVLAPSGDLAAAWILGSVSSAGQAPAERRGGLWLRQQKDGATISYDRHAHQLRVSIPGDILIEAEGSMTLRGRIIDLNP
ncbi:MAG: phage baseplate assembly protein V [Aphanocapsa feldmannii 277cI]|uniref:Phage baseplate assembly protein V n=1 Tax=Aphanocapsa feldmannii 277cI TaxID=2507554 RepID=A0A524RVZ0_9CHRO|nr:MAG: phage baseplate assembly protein V [Aphanocapsa feldmannii 277cI]